MNETYAKRDIKTYEKTDISSEEFNKMFNSPLKQIVNVDRKNPKLIGHEVVCFLIDNTLYYHIYPKQISDIMKLKEQHRPENKDFYLEKPHERLCENRKRTRPWDNCWFSNKPHIINLTVEQAINKYPQYMLWCYDNLTRISWSVYTIRMFENLRANSGRLQVC